jgi:predicted metalloprotease with PDZ domain
MAAKKDIEKAVKFKEFQRSVDKLLTAEDQDYLFYALKEYNTYKSVGKLMLALNSCLDSSEKLDLLPYIRDLIPKHDKKRFDNLAPYNRMAHPIKLEAVNGTSSPNGTPPANVGNRIINLQRTKGSSLGFSIRGGQEHELGIYVSHVESLSQAEKSGLQVGDKLIRVNGIDFERVSHGSAVLVLKSHDNLKIEVKNVGKVPGQTLAPSAFVW